MRPGRCVPARPGRKSWPRRRGPVTERGGPLSRWAPSSSRTARAWPASSYLARAWRSAPTARRSWSGRAGPGRRQDRYDGCQPRRLRSVAPARSRHGQARPLSGCSYGRGGRRGGGLGGTRWQCRDCQPGRPWPPLVHTARAGPRQPGGGSLPRSGCRGRRGSERCLERRCGPRGRAPLRECGLARAGGTRPRRSATDNDRPGWPGNRSLAAPAEQAPGHRH